MSSSGIELDETFTELVNGAYEAGRPILIAYVDGDGQPRLSYRGTVQVYSPDQLAFWVRDREGGVSKALPNNPHITFFYRDNDTKTQYLFYGRGYIPEDGPTLDAIFDGSPKAEQEKDPDRKGGAIIVDLDLVEGGPSGARISLRRS